MRVVDCFGPPRERGRVHGESLRAEVAEALGRWEAARLSGPAGPASIGAYAAALVGETRLMAMVRDRTPGLYEELVGIAEGAGQPLDLIAAWNLMDEQWWFEGRDAPPPGCSLAALPVAGGHVMAQTMDLPVHMDGGQVVLRLGGPDMAETLLLSAPGLIGMTGVTASGLAIGVNTLLMLNHDAGGLPVAFALRHALAARDAEAAAARLAGLRHASGQHYAAVDRARIVSLECSAGGCVTVDRNGPALLHTNHPFASTDIDPRSEARLARAAWARSTHARLDWLERSVPARAGADAVQALFDAEDAPICLPRGALTSFSFAAVLYELGETVRARMRAGPAGSGDWVELGFGEVRG